MAFLSWHRLILGTSLCIAAATAGAADVTLRVTVTNGSVNIGPPPGAASASTPRLPSLQCASPQGTKTCDFKVAAGSAGVVIAQLPTTGHAVRWGEACAPTLKDFCSLVVKADTQVTALIGAARNVAVETTPGGRVSSGDLACVGKCTLKTLDGAPVQFVATPDVGFVFVGWDQPPSCGQASAGSSPNSCVITAGPAMGPVQARFGRATTQPTLSLSVKSGTVTVKNSPSATTSLADCTAAAGQTSTCRVQVPAQTPLYLQLAPQAYGAGRPAEGRKVTWGGACQGNADTCNLLADRDQVVSAQVDPAMEVEVSSVGTAGRGTASTNLGGTCPDRCKFTLPLGDSLTITAQPAPGRRFAHWGPASPCASEKSATCTLKATQSAVYLVVPFFE